MLWCRRKQGCRDWEAFLISFMCSDGQIQVRNCRIKELNKIQTWGLGEGGYSHLIQEYSDFFFLCVCPHSWFFLESSVIDLWDLSSGVWFSALTASGAAVSRGWCPPDGHSCSAFCWKLRRIKRTAGSSTTHCSCDSVMVRSFYYLPRLLVRLLIRHNSLRETLSFKDAFKCEMQHHRSGTQNRENVSSRQTDREWLIAFFSGWKFNSCQTEILFCFCNGMTVLLHIIWDSFKKVEAV